MDTEHEFDVFISYSSRDRTWVRGELLKGIEEAGLRAFIDFRDFRRGAPSIGEMERGVRMCRKTVVVLTPDYVESEWAEVETIMVQTLDPANRSLRLIPLLRADCDIPLRVSALTHVDFRDGADLDLAWRQLLQALGAPPETSHPPVLRHDGSSLPHPDRVSAGSAGGSVGLPAYTPPASQPLLEFVGARIATKQFFLNDAAGNRITDGREADYIQIDVRNRALGPTCVALNVIGHLWFLDLDGSERLYLRARWGVPPVGSTTIDPDTIDLGPGRTASLDAAWKYPDADQAYGLNSEAMQIEPTTWQVDRFALPPGAYGLRARVEATNAAVAECRFTFANPGRGSLTITRTVAAEAPSVPQVGPSETPAEPSAKQVPLEPRLGVLRELRSLNREQARTSAVLELDLKAVAARLGLSRTVVRDTLVDLLADGSAEAYANSQEHSAPSGRCRITAVGMRELTRLEAQDLVPSSRFGDLSAPARRGPTSSTQPAIRLDLNYYAHSQKLEVTNNGTETIFDVALEFPHDAAPLNLQSAAESGMPFSKIGPGQSVSISAIRLLPAGPVRTAFNVHIRGRMANNQQVEQDAFLDLSG